MTIAFRSAASAGLACALLGGLAAGRVAAGEPARRSAGLAPAAPGVPAAPPSPAPRSAFEAAHAPAAPGAAAAPGPLNAVQLSLSRDFEAVVGADGSAALQFDAVGSLVVDGAGYRVWLAGSGPGDFERLDDLLFIDLDRDGQLDPDAELIGADGIAVFGGRALRIEITR